MTYGLGISVDDGLLMIADTRTNAGVDNISCYRKLHCLQDEPGRQIYAASSGSLSVSQAARSRLAGPDPAAASIAGAQSMFDIACEIGRVLSRENATLRETLGPQRRCEAHLLLGGRIDGEPPRLFMIYPEGNFIECMADLPYLQIGETKYGRPILDRTVTRHTSLAAAVKLGFLSFDSAMRSNLSVARPLDLVIIPADPGAAVVTRRIASDDIYFNELSRRWSATLVAAAAGMPEPDFLDADAVAWTGTGVVTELRAH